MGIILMHVRDSLAQNETNGSDTDHSGYRGDAGEAEVNEVCDLKMNGDEHSVG